MKPEFFMFNWEYSKNQLYNDDSLTDRLVLNRIHWYSNKYGVEVTLKEALKLNISNAIQEICLKY